MNTEFDNLNVPAGRSKTRPSDWIEPNVLRLSDTDGSAWNMNGKILTPTGFHSQSIVSQSAARIDLWDAYFRQTPKKKLPSWWQVSLWPVRVRKTARFDGLWKLPYLPDAQPARPDESV